MTRSEITQFSRLASRVALVCVSVCLLTTFIVVGSGFAVPPSTSAHAEPATSAHQLSSTTVTNQSSSPTHTLIIRAGNSPGKYIVSTTGNVTVSKLESSDIIQQPVIQGAVGENNDTVDVIRYTGHITSFNHRGSLHTTLDGRVVDPSVLDANYIRISSIKRGTTEYLVIGNGTIVPGGDADRNDHIPKNHSQVTGHVSGKDPVDSFYYTGRLVSGRASTNLTIAVNGRQVNVHHKTEAPDNATSQAPESSTETVTAPNQDTNGETQPPRLGSTEQVHNEDKDNDGGGLSLLQLIGGIVGMLLVAILGLLFLAR